MTTAPSQTSAAQSKSMDDIVALCRRRGFIFQSSEIYGGINGFWDYGPLGAQLKRNLKQAWWQDVVEQELTGPDGPPVDIVGLDTTIITHPKVWQASGHVAGFSDPMVDCRESKARYRADHILCIGEKGDTTGQIYTFIDGDEESLARARKKLEKYKKRSIGDDQLDYCPFASLSAEEIAITIGPDATKPGTLTEPRQFNLMFETYVGAVRDEENKAFLRPETAQGIFINFWNIVDSSRVKVPFGIAQQGKAFRNEVTPRNFTFRSREFEQMEIEFFIHPSTANEWYSFWRDQRFKWWQSVGLASSRPVFASMRKTNSPTTRKKAPARPTSNTSSPSPPPALASWKASPTAPTSTSRPTRLPAARARK
jgi:glycyl-tRNA synthetase